MVRVLQAAALEDEYDLLAEPATGSRIVCAALVRKGLLRGTPRWVDHFPPGCAWSPAATTPRRLT